MSKDMTQDLNPWPSFLCSLGAHREGTVGIFPSRAPRVIKPAFQGSTLFPFRWQRGLGGTPPHRSDFIDHQCQTRPLQDRDGPR